MAHICEYGSLLQGYRTFLNTYHPSIYLFRKHRLHVWRDGGAGRAVRDGPDNLAYTESMVITSWAWYCGLEIPTTWKAETGRLKIPGLPVSE